MVATQKLYPRGTVKRIVKAHAGRNISKNADVLVRLFSVPVATPDSMNCSVLTLPQIFLDYMLFMQEYATISPSCASIHNAPSLYIQSTNILKTITRLMREASIRSRKAGEKGISARNIRKVTEVNILSQFSVVLNNADLRIIHRLPSVR